MPAIPSGGMMQVSTVVSAGFAVGGRSMGDIVNDEGTATSAHALAMCTPGAAIRDLSDAVHAWCSIHGAAPSIVELAITARGGQDVQEWMRIAAIAFDEERRALAALSSAIGPSPSTPGQAEAHAAIAGQQHALATLARSDRNGCALGAAIALLLDWHDIRDMLNTAGYRTGVDLPPTTLPMPGEICAIAARLAADPSCARAMRFGAEQLIAQHRGLWHLLAARAGARDAQ